MSKLENLVATHSTFRKNASPAELQVAQAELNRIRATVMRMQRSGSPRVELQAEPGSSSSPQVELQAELLAEAAAAAAAGNATLESSTLNLSQHHHEGSEEVMPTFHSSG